MLLTYFFRALCVGVALVTVSGQRARCWTCDQSPGCFECLSKSDNGDGTSTVELDFSGCKNDDVSWACCTGSSGPGFESGDCVVPSAGCFGKDDEANDPDGESPKCEDVSTMFVLVPSDATAVTVNTHDGAAAGPALVGADPICAGREYQGGRCATKDNSITSHCLETIDLSSCPTAASSPSPMAAPTPSTSFASDPPSDVPSGTPVAIVESDPPSTVPTAGTATDETESD